MGTESMSATLNESQSRRRQVVVIGAGGHGRVVARAADACGIEVIGFYDDDAAKWGTRIDDVPVLGSIEEAAASAGRPAVMGIGDNATRKSASESLDLDWISVIHPFTSVDSYATLGRGTVLLPGSIVHRGTIIGDHVILNTKASVDHDCRVGDYVHIAVAHMAGGSSADEGSFLALGSVLLPGVNLGAWSILGAGAVAIDDIPANSVAVGIPARVHQ